MFIYFIPSAPVIKHHLLEKPLYFHDFPIKKPISPAMAVTASMSVGAVGLIVRPPRDLAMVKAMVSGDFEFKEIH